MFLHPVWECIRIEKIRTVRGNTFHSVVCANWSPLAGGQLAHVSIHHPVYCVKKESINQTGHTYVVSHNSLNFPWKVKGKNLEDNSRNILIVKICLTGNTGLFRVLVSAQLLSVQKFSHLLAFLLISCVQTDIITVILKSYMLVFMLFCYFWYVRLFISFRVIHGIQSPSFLMFTKSSHESDYWASVL